MEINHRRRNTGKAEIMEGSLAVPEGEVPGGSGSREMSYPEVMEYVEGLGRYGIVPGLGNMENLCGKLGNPQDSLQFVHIAGTNGKGSTLAFLSQILKEAGYRTGRYLSPTIFDYRERIQANNRPISKKELCRQMAVMREACEELVREGKPHPTAFEIETAMAFQYFKEQGCQVVVLETGMGGLLDATNIITNTLLAVFTSISYDHMAVLGKSLKEIAWNKAGIMKPGAAAVALLGEDEVMEALTQKAQGLGVPMEIVDPREAKGIRRGLEKQLFSYREYPGLEIRLAGLYQVENALLAVAAAKQLSGAGFSISWQAVYKGLSGATWPGRFQVLAKKPYVVADGAHNRDGACRLAQSIQFYFAGRRIVYIIGMLRDKEHEEILKTAAPLAQHIITVPTKGPRGFASYELALCAGRYHGNVTAEDSVEEAVEMAYLLADKDTAIIAFGSLSYLGSLIKAVERKNSKGESHGKQRKN